MFLFVRYQQAGGGSCTPQGGPPSYPRTQESLTVPSVGSPPSAAPSPLPNPHSAPPSEPGVTGEQPMPTLSPQPPAGPPPHSPLDVKPPITPSDPPKSQDSQVSPSHHQTNTETHQTNDGNNANNSQSHCLSLKRPILNSKEYENALLEEEQTLDLLYDYSTLEAW